MTRTPKRTPGNYRWRAPEELSLRPELIQYSVKVPSGARLTICRPAGDNSLPTLPHFAGQPRKVNTD